MREPGVRCVRNGLRRVVGVASPGMASWNQLLGWLREMNELRLALAEKAA